MLDAQEPIRILGVRGNALGDLIRIAFIALLLSFIAASTWAQTAQVQRIEVTEFGIYTAKQTEHQGAGSSGIEVKK